MSSICATPIRGRKIRLIKLDSCGNVVTGAGSAMVIMDGFISIKVTPQYEDGTEVVKKRADGSLCVNDKSNPQIKFAQVDGDWCVLDPDAIVIMNGSRLLTNGATGTGMMMSLLSAISARWSLEIWQDVYGVNACNAQGQQQYVYWAFPNVHNAQIQDFTAQNDSLEWKEQAEAQGAGFSWGTFPTANSPNSYLGTNIVNFGDVFGYNITSVAPPAASCGAQTVS